MTTRELLGTVDPQIAVQSAVRTADANGLAINMAGFESLMFVALVGISGDVLSGSVFAELEVEEADDDGTGSPGAFTDVANADLSKYVTGTNPGTFALVDDPAEDDAIFVTTYRGSKEWVRAVVNLTGTHTNGIPIAIAAIRGHPHVTPTDRPTD